MIFSAALLMFLIGQTAAGDGRRPAGCALGVTSDAAVSELCLGDDDLQAADALPAAAAQRSRQLEAAAAHYRRAVSLASRAEPRVLALESLTKVYDARHLNRPREVENALRELIAQQPDDLKPAFRLAKLLEDEELTDAAEDVLLSARRQQPDSVEPYRMLAQYYARRATAFARQAQQQQAPARAGNPGERDENGVYRVGGPIAPPSRLDVARYPPEAVAAGIQGNVLAEIVVNESGDVSDARVVRSIPMLDEAALQAVRNWHFAPTMVNGQSVAVRMVVTVNFSTR